MFFNVMKTVVCSNIFAIIFTWIIQGQAQITFFKYLQNMWVPSLLLGFWNLLN